MQRPIVVRRLLATAAVGLLAGCADAGGSSEVVTGETTEPATSAPATAVVPSAQGTPVPCPPAGPGTLRGSLIASFPSTAGQLKAFGPLGVQEPSVSRNWADVTDETPASLCWYDGMVAKSPPPGPDGAVQPPFDRFAVAVFSSERFEFLVAGYQQHLQPRGPE